MDRGGGQMKETIAVGTVLLIDDDFVEEMEKLVDTGVIPIIEKEMWYQTVYKEWIPRKIRFFNHRLNRRMVVLAWDIIGEDLVMMPQINLTIFEKMGYNIVKPESTTIALVNCSDDLLSPTELVEKYLILQNPKKSRKWVDKIMGYVGSAMGATGVVFYRY